MDTEKSAPRKVSSKAKPVIFILAVFFLLSESAAADPDVSDVPGSKAVKISLVTILPGSALYATFGHTALRVEIPSRGVDTLYNYAESVRPFDLSFLGSLFIGRMEFTMGAEATSDAYSFYRNDERRTVVEQELNFDTAQGAALYERLRRNLASEDRVYHYRFLTNNCTTKVWDVLEDYLSARGIGMIAPPTETYRTAIDRVASPKPVTRLAMLFLLGPFADAPRGPVSKPFLPMELMEVMGGIEMKEGRDFVSFAGAPRVLPPEREPRKPNLAIGLTFVPTLALLLISILLSLFFSPRRAIARAFDIALLGTFSAAGLALAILWFIARYDESIMNLNLIWASPLLFLAFLPGRKKSIVGALVIAQAIAGTAVALSGGIGAQEVAPEIRLMAAAVSVRLAASFVQRGPLVTYIRLALSRMKRNEPRRRGMTKEG